jgi:hypothetical protein
MLIVLLAVAQLQFGPNAKADLDGDGKEEAISFEPLPTGVIAYALRAGDATIGRFIDDQPHVVVVDLDSSDKTKELMIVQGGDNDLRDYTLFRYEKKKLIEIGKFGGQIPSDPEITGNGFVTVGAWQGFYTRTVKFARDKTGKLNELVPELYAVGVDVEVKATFPMYTTRAKKDVLGRTKVGSKVTLVAHDPSPKCAAGESGFQACDWFLVRSSTGLLGWVLYSDLEKGVDLPFAG